MRELPKQVLDLATPERCKAELTYVTRKRTAWKLNPRPRKSNAYRSANPKHSHVYYVRTVFFVSTCLRFCCTQSCCCYCFLYHLLIK